MLSRTPIVARHFRSKSIDSKAIFVKRMPAINEVIERMQTNRVPRVFVVWFHHVLRRLAETGFIVTESVVSRLLTRIYGPVVHFSEVELDR